LFRKYKKNFKSKEKNKAALRGKEREPKRKQRSFFKRIIPNTNTKRYNENTLSDFFRKKQNQRRYKLFVLFVERCTRIGNFRSILLMDEATVYGGDYTLKSANLW